MTAKQGRGRPVVLTPCPWCHREYPVAELRGHQTKCRKERDARQAAGKRE